MRVLQPSAQASVLGQMINMGRERGELWRLTVDVRDIEIAADGTVYTSTSSFPSWHVEDGQPTLIRVQTKAP